MSTPGGGFDYPQPAIQAAARSALSAADQARGVDLAGAVDPISTAMPGADAARAGDRLSEAWHREIRAWCDDMARYGTAVKDSGHSMGDFDTGVGGLFNGMPFGPALGTTPLPGAAPGTDPGVGPRVRPSPGLRGP